MADKQSIHRLIEHREELANTLDPHVDSLVQKFSDLKLFTHKDTSTLEDKPKQQKINLFLDIIHQKVENNDSKSYEELITYMKSAQEYTSLPTLANKMTNPEEVPFGQPVESESSPQVVQGEYCILTTIYTYIHASCVCKHTHTHACTHTHTLDPTYTCTRTYTHSYTHTRAHTHTHTHTPTHTHTNTHTHQHTHTSVDACLYHCNAAILIPFIN